MTSFTRQQLGKWGEQAAAQYLTTQGHQIIETNYRTPYGEIDLITRMGDITIFVEVKTRATDTFGKPEVSITPRKQTHMIQSAQYYIQQHTPTQGSWRIDVISILRPKPGEPAEITHFENAIS